ncbi:MAG TPA: hypothetical protein VLK03_05685 [Nocardioides sp.]|nr:hypothetical protein [Nocardioides sp.]
MSVQSLPSAATSRRRRAWTIFWAVSGAAVSLCFVAALRSSGTTGAGLALVGGLIVVGIAASLMASIVSAAPDQLTGRHGTGGGFDGGSGSGGFGGGGFDGGGGGGDCG